MKKILILLLTISMFFSSMPIKTLGASLSDTTISVTNSLGEVGGYLSGNWEIATHLYKDSKFTANQGHGFAAENANNLIDKLLWKDATVVGNDFVKNGADRKIIGRSGEIIWIQTKYYGNVAQGVNAMFDETTGLYKYYKDGKPMVLEVPKGQKKEAVQLLRQKIEQKLVPNVTNPDEAESLVREGNVTYEQAKNIAKAGNFDSLVYDATTGAITATSAAGISFVVDFACCTLNGIDLKVALKEASLNGLKTGSVVFATYVISSQIAKTGVANTLTNALVPTAEAIANTLGDDVCRAILKQAGVDATEMVGKTAINNVARILSKELVADGVLIVVLTGIDVVELFRGRISKEELLKNLTVTIISGAAGTAGGIGGGVLGTLVSPGVGTTVGAIVGSTVVGGAAGILSDLLIDKFYESDAEEMYEIISEEFLELSEEYLVSETEGEAITEKLKNKLVGNTLKDMYASEDRNAFARQLIEPLFMEQVTYRPTVEIPTEEEIRLEYKTIFKDIVFIH